MTDWRELPAGKELDHVIAAELNYIDPISGAYLWPGEEGQQECPKFSTDANAALSLPLAERTRLELFVHPNGQTHADIIDTLAIYVMSIGDADTPALAICRAWLTERRLT